MGVLLKYNSIAIVQVNLHYNSYNTFQPLRSQPLYMQRTEIIYFAAANRQATCKGMSHTYYYTS